MLSDSEKIPPEELRSGRRALEGIDRVTLLEDLKRNDDARKWTLHVRLDSSASSGSSIPRLTDWYVLIDNSYPRGKVRFYPAKDKGIVATFHHQMYNGEGPATRPWRDGHLCLETSLYTLERFDTEPRGVQERLQWHFRRALEWLDLAARGELVSEGEAFELPDFPKVNLRGRVAFSENMQSLGLWLGASEKSGIVELVASSKSPTILFVKKFLDSREHTVYEPKWGNFVQQSKHTFAGIWLRFDAVPVLSPWQAPASWGELRQSGRAQGININRLLRKCVPHIRDSERHWALVGFPIPDAVGGDNKIVHWQALLMPQLCRGHMPRYPNKEKGRWWYDRDHSLSDDSRIEWQNSENWAKEQITTRGKLAHELISKKVALIGAGAVGSVVAELLVRAGVEAMTVVDDDNFVGGNLVRHTLTICDVGLPKATSLTFRLSSAYPHAKVNHLQGSFPPLQERDRELLRQCEVVIDCTASDDVLYSLQEFAWSGSPTIFSVSLGFGARRLFFFGQKGGFSADSFMAGIRPWLQKEAREVEGTQLPREGVGCWHPVFPARANDIWLMSSLAVSLVESVVVNPPASPIFKVFEQCQTQEEPFELKEVQVS